MVACAIVLAAANPIAAAFLRDFPEIAIGAIASAGAFGLTALFVRWEGLRLSDVGAAIDRGSVARFTAGFLGGLVLVFLWASLSAAAGLVRWVFAADVDFAPAVVALVGYLLLSAREEIAFRGYPLRRLHSVLGLAGAQTVVALLFALEHRLGGSPWLESLLGAGLGSLLFGIVALVTRGLAAPIGVHAAWNFGQWALGVKGKPGFWKPLAGESFHDDSRLAGMIAYAVVIASATMVLWWIHLLKSRLPNGRA